MAPAAGLAHQVITHDSACIILAGGSCTRVCILLHPITLDVSTQLLPGYRRLLVKIVKYRCFPGCRRRLRELD